MKGLEGRTAIVTGAGQGIGRGVAISLARKGANIVVCDVCYENIVKVVDEIEGLGAKALCSHIDITRSVDVDRMVRQAVTEFGSIDILVNNAGTAFIEESMEQTEFKWDAVLNLNLKALFFCSQRIAREMIARRFGAIINIASIAAFSYTVPHAPYAASKAGVVALTRDMAVELAKYCIRVNAVAPGLIETPLMQQALTAEERRAYASNIPLGRFGQVEDIGEAVAFLASDVASFITGVTLPVSGGSELRIAYG